MTNPLGRRPKRGRRLPGQSGTGDGFDVTLVLKQTEKATIINKELVQVGRITTGDYVNIDQNGIELIANSTLHIDLQSDGDIFIGKDTSAAADTFVSIFSNAQTYNSESMGAGDMLLGDNSAGQPNLFWDRSVPEISIRSGTTKQLTLGSSLLVIGDTSSEHIEVTSTAVNIKDGATTHAQLSGGTLTLGETATEHITIDNTGLFIYEGANELLLMSAGNLRLGDATSENVQITSTAVKIRDATTNYMLLQAGTLTVGQTSTEHVEVTSTAVSINDGGTTYSQLSSGTLTLGRTSDEHINITSSAVEFKNGDTVRANLTGNTWELGRSATEHIEITTGAVNINDGGTTYSQLSSGTLTLGRTSDEHINITSSAVEFKNGDTVRANLTGNTWELGRNSTEHVEITTGAVNIKDGSDTLASLSSGTLTLGDTSTEHVNITSSRLQFKDGSTVYGELTAGGFTIGDTSGDHVNVASAIEIKDGSVVKGQWQTDGDFFLGSNIANPDDTYFSIFATSQTYNSELMSAGDMLIGDNSSSKANIFWDKSAAQLKFRGGTTTRAYIDTTGAITAGGGDVIISSTGITLAAGTGNTNKLRALDGSDSIGEFYADVDTGVAGILSLRGRGKDSGTHEGYVEIIAITDDGSAHAGAASVAIEAETGNDLISLTATYTHASGAVKVGNITTTARDNLNASNGHIIYNTTTNKFQGYENGSWVDLV